MRTIKLSLGAAKGQTVYMAGRYLRIVDALTSVKISCASPAIEADLLEGQALGMASDFTQFDIFNAGAAQVVTLIVGDGQFYDQTFSGAVEVTAAPPVTGSVSVNNIPSVYVSGTAGLINTRADKILLSATYTVSTAAWVQAVAARGGRKTVRLSCGYSAVKVSFNGGTTYVLMNEAETWTLDGYEGAIWLQTLSVVGGLSCVEGY